MQMRNEHCPRCGGVLGRRGKVAAKCARCGFLRYAVIKITASVILENEKREILMLKKKNNPYAGLWDTPGGHINPGETALEAAVRETREETGLRPEKLEYNGTYVDTYLDQGVKYPLLAVSFCGKIFSSEKIKMGDDAADYKYFRKNNIPWRNMCFKSDIEALKFYFKRKSPR